MECLYPIRLLKDHAYAVVDPGAVADLPPDWPLVRLVPQGLDKEKSMLPALLAVNALKSDQRMHLLDMLDEAHRQEDPLPVVTFLDSEVEPERMRMHWVQQLILALPNRDKFLMRSHDPRVFAQLQWMYTPAQLKALFGPVRRWTIYLDRRWQTAHPPAHDGLPGGRIDARQAALLARISPINEVLFRLPDAQRRAHETASRAIDTLLLRAQSHGLTRDEDLLQFALHGMHIHPRFDSHPEIIRLLAERDPEEQTYADAAALLDDAAWARITEETMSVIEKRTP